MGKNDPVEPPPTLFGNGGQSKGKLLAPLFAATPCRNTGSGKSDTLVVAAGGGSSKTGVKNELVRRLHTPVADQIGRALVVGLPNGVIGWVSDTPIARSPCPTAAKAALERTSRRFH